MFRVIKKAFNPVSYYRLFSYIKRKGFKGIMGKFKSGMREGNSPDEMYELWFLKHRVKDAELLEEAKHNFSYSPKISILVPTYNTPKRFLKEMIDSVIGQSYSNWELCIADGSTDEKTKKCLREYAEKDKRIVITWLDKNYGISGNTNKALEIATGDFISMLDHDDVFEKDLLFEVVSALQDKSADMVYTDEDKIVGKRRSWSYKDPNFKPDFSIDLLRSHNYITHFVAIKKDIIDEIGGFRSEFDGSQDFDLLLRSVEKVLARKGKILHVPKVLYHWRIHSQSTAGNPESKLYCYEAGRKALVEHYERLGIKANVEMTDMWGLYHTRYETVGNPLLSIIIPNKDHIDDLEKCIVSLVENSTYKNVEFVVVENNSEDEKTFKYYEELEKRFDNVRVVYWKGIFNYAAINNFGVKEAKGDYLLLLNNDTELILPDSVGDMLGICMREEVGVVGPKLLFADDTIQHAGIVLGFGGFAGHVFTQLTDDNLGFMMRPRINCNYSAVTGACLMTKRSVYEEVGGLTEDFVVGLNDVDFCMKVRKKNYFITYDAFAKWHHYESKSRGYEDTPEKKKRFQGEIDLFQSLWGEELKKGDPFYNPNFLVTRAPFTLHPED